MALNEKPYVFMDETGERWWISGHLPIEHARVALACQIIEDENEPPAQAYERAVEATISHVYYRPDPREGEEFNDERMARCDADDPTAEPFTEITE